MGVRWDLVIPFLYFKINTKLQASTSKWMWQVSTCLSNVCADLKTVIALCKIIDLNVMYVNVIETLQILPSSKSCSSVPPLPQDLQECNRRRNFCGTWNQNMPILPCWLCEKRWIPLADSRTSRLQSLPTCVLPLPRLYQSENAN